MWELVPFSYNGRDLTRPSYHEQKVVTRGRFMWFGEERRRDTIALRTPDDTLRAFEVTGGAGTHSLDGDTYTERLKCFYDPRPIGGSVQATCRIEGDRWCRTFTAPAGTGATEATSPRIDEGWRRVSG